MFISCYTKGEIMKFDDFKILFDRFIENYLNKKPSKGKVLQGKCPDELWAEEFTNKKVISRDALKLQYMQKYISFLSLTCVIHQLNS